MMDFELRAKKIQKENDSRIQEAKRKRDREAKLKEEQMRREQELAEKANQLKLKLQQEEELRIEAENLRLQKNGGINFELSQLVPYLIENGEDDKVILPESCLAALNQQDAFSRGPLFFEISCTNCNDIVTHCGVREFSAVEGTIGLPPKLLYSLSRNSDANISKLGLIAISYTLLPKITLAKFKSYSENFFQISHIKRVLEDNLKLHSTLTTGDILNIWFRGKSYAFSVAEVQPQNSGTLFDTDVEIEFVSHSNTKDPSDSTLSSSMPPSLSAPQQPPVHANSSSKPNASTASALNPISSFTPSSAGYRLSAPSVKPAQSQFEPRLESVANSHADNAVDYKSYVIPSKLVPEPSADTDEGVVQIRLRVPTGASISRRFLESSKLLEVFYFASSSLMVPPVQVRLSVTGTSGQRMYALEDDSCDGGNMTLSAVGFQKREMIIVSIAS